MKRCSETVPVFFIRIFTRERATISFDPRAAADKTEAAESRRLRITEKVLCFARFYSDATQAPRRCCGPCGWQLVQGNTPHDNLALLTALCKDVDKGRQLQHWLTYSNCLDEPEDCVEAIPYIALRAITTYVHLQLMCGFAG